MDPKIYEENGKFLSSLCHFVTIIKQEEERLDSSPEEIDERVQELYRVQGSLEGKLLKGWGLLKDDFWNVLVHYAHCCNVSIRMVTSFPLPFEKNQIYITGRDDGELKFVSYYVSFLEALLSSYGLMPVVLEQQLEKPNLYVVVLKSSQTTISMSGEIKEQWSRDFHHKINNYLGGVLSFTSLLSKNMVEQEGLDSLEQTRDAILGAVRGIQEYIQKSIPLASQKESV